MNIDNTEKYKLNNLYSNSDEAKTINPTTEQTVNLEKKFQITLKYYEQISAFLEQLQLHQKAEILNNNIIENQQSEKIETHPMDLDP